MILVRKGTEVFFNGKKLTIVKQANKGENKEVVKIEGLDGSNGQKWISLRKLNQGENEVTCQQSTRTASTSTTTGPKVKDYELTERETIEVNELQARIDKIIEFAKVRLSEKPDFNVDLTKLSLDEVMETIKAIDSWKTKYDDRPVGTDEPVVTDEPVK